MNGSFIDVVLNGKTNCTSPAIQTLERGRIIDAFAASLTAEFDNNGATKSAMAKSARHREDHFYQLKATIRADTERLSALISIATDEPESEYAGLTGRAMVLRLCHGFKLPLRVFVSTIYALRVFYASSAGMVAAPSLVVVACLYLMAKVDGHAAAGCLPPMAEVEASNPHLQAEELKAVEKNLFMAVRPLLGANGAFEHINLMLCAWFGPEASPSGSLVRRCVLCLFLHNLLFDTESFDCSITLLPYALANSVLRCLERAAGEPWAAKKINDTRRAILQSCKLGCEGLIEAESRRAENMYHRANTAADNRDLIATFWAYTHQQQGRA